MQQNQINPDASAATTAQVIDVSSLSTAEMRDLDLSYYTLCRWADATHFTDPRAGVPSAIARGEYRGILTLDSLGNFLSFK